jgi:hypothetical protein
MKTLSEIRQVKELKEKSLFERAGVTGVDIGHKYVGGKRTDETAIRIYVDTKLPDAQVAKGQMVPKKLEGVKTDVIQRKYVLHPKMVRIQDIEIQEDATRYATLHGGISIGPCRSVHLEPPDVPAAGNYIFVGTLGAVVKDRSTGNQMLLSNFHVMCVDDGWQAGDQMCQPGRVDSGACPADVVGELQRAVLQGSTAGGGPGVDCAVASHTARPIECTIEEIGDVTGTATAAVGMAVRKRGRTTGLTYGTVDSVDLSVRVSYGDGLGEVILTHQISILPDPGHNAKFGDHGDSGSVVVDDNGRVIGLHFAGDDASGSGVANPIQAVLDALNVDLCTVKRIEKKIEVKEFEKKWEIKEHKLEKFERKELKELEKSLHKEIKEMEKWKDAVEGPGLPTVPTTPVQPVIPGAPRGLEERIAALEAALGLRAGTAPQAKYCIDFNSYPPQVTPNPWLVGGGSFLALDHAGNPWPSPGIKAMGGFTGLDSGFRMEIMLNSPCTTIEATLVHFSTASKIEAYNRDGSLAGTAAMSGPERVAETLRIAGAAIETVVILAPQDETLLLRFCCEGKQEEGKPLKEDKEKIESKEFKEQIKEWKEKPEVKELKDAKPERKELKDRAKEIKEYKEPKEIKERIKDFKEPKEIWEGTPKEWLEGGPKVFEGGTPPDPNPPVVPGRPGGLEERLARLEAAVAQMAHFVDPALRPNLSMGALKSEPDYSTGWKPYSK